MPRKGMRTICFSPKSNRGRVSSLISHFSSPSRFANSPSRPSFSESVMDRTLETVEPLIMKWDAETSGFAKVTSLFYENRRDARDYIKAVNNLQKAMHILVNETSHSDKLVTAQMLMQIAMKRLQKEFYQILSMNRAHLDPESVSTRSSRASTRSSTSDYDDEEDEVRAAGASITEVEDASNAAMADLRLIAECMISCGYAKECLKIYNIIRKSIIDEGIYKLGVEKLSSSQVHKMDREVLDLRIKNWLNAVSIAVKTLFNGERILCDHVFASSDTIRESCFAEISKEGAIILFGFPENIAKHSKKSRSNVFRLLDMYTAIADHWPDIESIFSFDSSSVIRSQALTSLIKLTENIKAALAEFESFLQKDSSKSTTAGAGIHALTVDAMTYLSSIADYSNILPDILADFSLPAKSSLPESFFGLSDSEDSPALGISIQFAWLVLVLLCKLDVKAKHYKDVSLAYLFLANNLQYVVVKVRTSNLKYLLGDEWISRHEAKVKQFAANYERLGWSHVINSLPEDPTGIRSMQEVKDGFKRFNNAFEQAHHKQSSCVVPDSKLRDEIKVSIARKILPAYREFYNAHRRTLERERNTTTIVKFAPEDIGHRLSDLFFGVVESGSSLSSTSSSSHSRPSRFR